MPQKVTLRKAQERDRYRVMGWKNLPESIALSASQQPVTLAEHDAWFTALLRDPDRLLLMIEPGIGMVRFDLKGNAAAASIFLVSKMRGKGIGSTVLRKACTRVFVHWPQLFMVFAKIRADNEASVAAFERAGFQPVGDIKNGIRLFACIPQPHRGQPGATHAAVHPVPWGTV